MRRVNLSVGIDLGLSSRFFPLYVYNGSVDRIRRVTFLLDSAKERVRAGDVSGALNLMRQASKLVPGDPKLFSVCADIFFEFQKYEEMAEFLHYAIGLSPKNPYLRIHRAWALACQGEFKEAREEIWSALCLAQEEETGRSYCYLLAGLIEFMDKHYWEAIARFYSAAKSEPLNRDYEMCLTLASLALRKYEAEAEQESKLLIISA